MIDENNYVDEITHNIERHIIRTLTVTSTARFTQMRPPRVDSNLYAYHLKQLIKLGYIIKNDRNYSLSPRGMKYADRFSLRYSRLVIQSKITVGILLKNEFNEILLTKRYKHPFLDFWGLMLSKTYADDPSILAAAQRTVFEEIKFPIIDMAHVGDCYVRTSIDGYEVSNILSHIFYSEVKKAEISEAETVRWVSLNELTSIEPVPGAEDIINLVLKSKNHFFAELKYDL